ncbi:caspase-1-like [Chrysoperla carnea]|uniref:caspase-1-like n=1 Tax=Chrysoperla carnea TaxID=189513 RepID=UPI001D083FBD|nr:caspase-1-like [Chrysoperla carnea]
MGEKPDATIIGGILGKISISDTTSKSCEEPHSFAIAPSLRDDIYYNMNFKKRGMALIFSHEKFGLPGVPERSETKLDLIKLEERLTALGFDVDVYIDKCVRDIEDKLFEVATSDHSNNDCLLVVIMTHGRYGILTAYDGEYRFENVWNHFTADKCPTLAGKPKIFITQACQGDSGQEGIELRPADDPEHDAALVSYKIPTHADFLFAHSTIKDHFAFRRSNYGSWYIQALCKELDLHGKTLDFVSLLTIVQRRVAIEFETKSSCKTLNEKKQIPCFVSLLTRLIKFADKN